MTVNPEMFDQCPNGHRSVTYRDPKHNLCCRLCKMEIENQKLKELGRVTIRALVDRRVIVQWPALDGLIRRWKNTLGE